MELHRRLDTAIKTEEPSVHDLIGPIIHEIQNSLQVIKLHASLNVQDPSETLHRAIQRIDRLLWDLRDHAMLPQPIFSQHRLEDILDVVVDKLRKKLSGKKITLRVVRRRPLPTVRVDASQFRKALARVLRFCRALLNDAGDLKIRIRSRETNSKNQVILTIESSSPLPLRCEEKNPFRPSSVGNLSPELGMALAQRIVRQHQGQITFQRRGLKRATITIRLAESSFH